MTEEMPVIKETPVTEETSVMEEMPVIEFDGSAEDEIDDSEKDFEEDTRNLWRRGNFTIHVYDQHDLTPEELNQCAELWLLVSGLDDFPQDGEISIAVAPINPPLGESLPMVQDPSGMPDTEKSGGESGMEDLFRVPELEDLFRVPELEHLFGESGMEHLFDEPDTQE